MVGVIQREDSRAPIILFMPRISFLLFVIFFPVIADSDQRNVRVSILSLLQPRQIRLTLLSPATGMLRNSDREVPILSGKTIELRAANRMLQSDIISGEYLSLNCSGVCKVQIQIDDKMNRFYSGQFEFQYNNSTMNIVLSQPREEFIGSVISSELRGAKHPEAIRAFAIVSRSFLSEGGRHPEKHADFCDTTHCQVFQNLQPSHEIQSAVQKSASLVLTYHDQLFKPYYSRSCGGQTATFQDAWGEQSQPYEFAAVSCPCSEALPRWQTSLSFEELNRISGFQNAKLHRVANRIVVSIHDAESQFPLEVFRTRLGHAYGWNKLPGNSYEMAQTSDGYVFRGRGQGHGVGFCQTGADILAAKGFSFTEILSHYFPGSEIRTQPPSRHDAKFKINKNFLALWRLGG